MRAATLFAACTGLVAVAGLVFAAAVAPIGPRDGLPRLAFPLPAADRAGLHDSFREKRGGRAHEAVDIMAARGTPVRAVDDGRVAKLFNSERGGLTVYQFDPGMRFTYYYAHLDRYAAGLAEGKTLKRGDLIGYVGSTGNAAPEAPHLHFGISRLGAERQWWKGEPLDPYPLLSAPAP